MLYIVARMDPDIEPHRMSATDVASLTHRVLRDAGAPRGRSGTGGHRSADQRCAPRPGTHPGISSGPAPDARGSGHAARRSAHGTTVPVTGRVPYAPVRITAMTVRKTSVPAGPSA